MLQSGRSSIGDSIYRQISTPNKFSPDFLLDGLDKTCDHEALEIANRVEAAIYVWQRKAGMSNSKSSWDMVKDLMADGDKNHMLVSRAESLLLCLKLRYPELSQTTLDTSKIQYNKVRIQHGVWCLNILVMEAEFTQLLLRSY